MQSLEAWALLRKIRRSIPVEPLQVRPSSWMKKGSGAELKSMSILVPALQTHLPKTSNGEATPHLLSDEDTFAVAEMRNAGLVDVCVQASTAADRAVGAMVGLVLGDSVGAPLEFTDADGSLPPYPKRRPHLKETLDDKGRLVYVNEFNTFQLHRGQWTDDASMSLCLADSLIQQKQYEGSDCRCRYYLWWFFGYNNAFRFDPNPRRSSVGLGGNISKSIDEVSRLRGQPAANIPPNFTATGEDAGNGSIMRLAPIPVRYHNDVADGMKQAAEQSLGTHPGHDAAACCVFMTYLQIKAIHSPADHAVLPITDFLDQAIQSFLTDVLLAHGGKPSNSGMAKLEVLLRSKPATDKEALWNWRVTGPLAIEETLEARGHKYNGYPVIPSYFGSYCMDGLAMALWSLWNSTSAADCLVKVTNLLGDADSTGAVAGQMAGAFYGYRSIVESTMGSVFVKNLRAWDPLMEIELRALILFMDGEKKANRRPADEEEEDEAEDAPDAA